MPISRAILSVSDKGGIVELARVLAARKVEILSTGGTAKHLAEAGVPVTAISSWSGAPEILGGRVKTLTPKVFGAILHDRDNPLHMADCERQSIPPIDLVVVNLYPFEQTIAREGVTLQQAIEQIDVGGPSMLRAAAKNYRHVLPLCDPSLYADFMREFESGELSTAFRLRCAIEVFRRTSQYDGTIARFLASRSGDAGAQQPGVIPDSLNLELAKFQDLRYGENPQQRASFFVTRAARPFVQIQGKELSYNNLIDLDSAMRMAAAFEEPACAVIKHTNPCGVGRERSIAAALRLAIDADPVSAFGGIIGANGEFDADAAAMIEPLFLEVIVAPSFSKSALSMLSKKKNLRLVTSTVAAPELEFRSAAGGLLAQSGDRIASRETWKVVTSKNVTAEEMDGLDFAWRVCAHVKSNAIVLTSLRQSIGIGAGQMSRVDAAKVAIMKASAPTAGTLAASDAFFPFRDGLDILAEAGVRAIIQPGGSMRDAEVIAAADERGLAMVFTGERHFRH